MSSKSTSSEDTDKRRTPKGPRRLFSFDSTKSSSSRRTASETSLDSQQSRGHARLATLSDLPEDGDETALPWTKTELVESPLNSPELNPFNDAQRPESPRPSFFKSKPKLDLAVLTPGSREGAPPSPSSARWDHVRQHVIPVVPSTSTSPPAHVQQQPSSASTFSSRSQTPKATRIAQRFGFKQVVDHVREVAIDDSRKFAYELQKTCWATRFGEVKSNPMMNTHGSSLSINQLTNVTSTKARRQSLPTQAINASLKQLYHVLLHHSAAGIRVLPVESLVLSTLLLPFLSFEKGVRIDDERWFAMESFEVIRTTWSPADEASAVDRCMWCVKAAFIPSSPLRLRVLSSLWNLIVPPESVIPISTPAAYISVSQGLFFLLPFADAQTKEGKTLSQIIQCFRSGSCGNLDAMAVEQDYNAIFLDADTQQAVRDALLIEGIGKCIENVSESDRKWLLTNTIDEFWPVPSRNASFSPLLTSIHSRKLSVFTRVFCSLLESSAPDSNTRLNDSLLVIKIIRERVLPELDALSPTAVFEAKRNFVKAVLIMLTAEDATEVGRWCIATISLWYREAADWKSTFEKGLKHVIAESSWPLVFLILTSLAQVLPQEVQKNITAQILPALHDRLLEDEPPHPCPPLTALLSTLSRSSPQLFYKPLFSCAAATKEVAVVNHLRTINVITKFMPDFWTRDAEMIVVAIASDIGGATNKDQDSEHKWGVARLGQSLLLIELVTRIQEIRRGREGNTIPDAAFVELAKFVYELEVRLGSMLRSREGKVLIPPSQRIFYCILLREARLLTRSMKAASWLRLIVSWFTDYQEYVDEEYFHDEVETAVTAIKEIYVMLQDVHHHKRRSTRALSIAVDPLRMSSADNNKGRPAPTKHKLLSAAAKGYANRVMKLLVTMSLILESDDFRRIGPIVWERYLEDGLDPSTLASACCLIMYCAEKVPTDLQATIEVDFGSLDRLTKMKAISRISTLSNWRFQILSQQVVADRSRRPFKLARPPLPFIPTDMGSVHYVRRDDQLDGKDSLPMDMRKRLAEIGWVEDDAPVNQQMERIQTPFSLLPVQQLDRLQNKDPQSFATSPGPSPMSSPSNSKSSPTHELDEITLLRRNSSTGGPLYGVKRRAIFVPSLTRIFPMLSSMVFDSDFAVAHAARATVIDLMRNDPALLTRPVLDLLADDTKDIPTAISSLRAFLHVRQMLPPSMSHHIFNHLTGFLKHTAKNATTDDALHDYALVIPILAKLVGQVSDLSSRDFRRAKVDTFFIPSGALYFHHSAPNPYMFPSSLGQSKNPFDDRTSRLISVIMVRISQNILFLDMLQKNPQDIQLVRKNMTRLVLPSWDDFAEAKSLELNDFVPRKERPSIVDHKTHRLRSLSILLSRSYLPLVAQIFRSMSRHLNDRSELAVLVDGINRILVAHGHDIGIVSQSLIALMVASTRFHRLFFSRGGYTLFMPAVLKVYTEAEMNSGIKAAVEYALNRFFAHHREAFVYQSLDVMSHVLAIPEADASWIAKSVYTLFSSLKSTSSPRLDPAGIHDSNKRQEREALMMITAEEKPQTFLASLRRGGKNSITIELPEEYEAKRLTVDNLVRLFLTVIAHDITTRRSEQFLSLLRYLTPFLYDASGSARPVLQQGIEALSSVLLRVSPKSKTDAPKMASEGIPQDVALDEILDQQLNEKSKTPSDFMAMRLHYFFLVNNFIVAGGQLPTHASHRNIELVKVLLREGTKEVNDAVASFLASTARASYCSSNPRNVKTLVAFIQDLAPVINSYALTVDFSGLFDVISELCENPSYANEPAFTRIIMTQICSAGLDACDMAASESLLFTLHCRLSLVRLLSQAVFLNQSDVLGEIEKYSPTHEFLSGVVLPLALMLKTTTEIDQDSRRPEPWHREAHRRAWIRLLAYTMSACQRRPRSRSSDGSGLERSKSQDGAIPDKSHALHSMVIALQILKVIVVRAEIDLGSLPGVWIRVATFTRSILADGNADFTSGRRDYSPSASPTPSPRASGQFDFSPATMYAGFNQRKAYHNPRMVDYCLWSTLELLCLHRTPLVLQMRLFMKEKVLLLDSQLRSQQQPQSRPSSSVFAKPRRRQSGIPAVSPDHSPRLRPSGSSGEHQDTSFFSLNPYNSPVSPSTQPRIIHLGPTAIPPDMQSSSSHMSSNSAAAQAKATRVKSMSLIQATYRRIRLVQSCLGYQSMLLPLPNEEGEEPASATWTSHQAVREIMNETRELLEEFDEEYIEGDSAVIINPDQSFG